jgi:cytoplasmic tRNA 2-thiolation protein 1
MFKAGERIAVAASGGKDSTVLAHVMKELNERHGYGLDLFLLSVDEGISGYRDDSLETVKRNEAYYGIPLKIVSYQDLYGWTMDEIVSQVGTKNNCTFCGVFRRQALDRGAQFIKADKVATGHNADDMAETILLNLLVGRLIHAPSTSHPHTSCSCSFQEGGCGSPWALRQLSHWGGRRLTSSEALQVRL